MRGKCGFIASVAHAVARFYTKLHATCVLAWIFAIDIVTVLCYIKPEVNEMENDLLSKKELLELTGISYGQLYRWKRKALIPEEWFVRKSTFTGQETFFPRDKILTRIEKIKNMKDEASLDQLADILSPNLSDIIVPRQTLLSAAIVSSASLELFEEVLGPHDTLSFVAILHVYLLDKMLRSGEISREEGKLLLGTLDGNSAKLEGRNWDLLFIRKLGVSTCVLLTVPNQVVFDDATKVAVRLNVSSCIEELKTKLAGAGIG